MKCKKKKLLVMILALTLSVNLFTTSVWAVVLEDLNEGNQKSAIVEQTLGSGTCGSNLTWTLSDDGTLTISGSGSMDSWSGNWHQEPTPWYENRDLIKKVVVEEGVTSIGSDAFRRCSNLTNIIMPDTLTSIQGYAFDRCSSLKDIDIPDGVTHIYEYTFDECSSLSNINISASVTDIEEYAFTGCSSLKSVVIPDSVTYIGRNAFNRCSSLTSVTFGSGVSIIGSYVFNECNSLNNITVSENNAEYSSKEGVLFNKDKTELLIYPLGKEGAYTIPNSVTSIANYAFYVCDKITNVIFPKSVTQIGDYAFSNCYGLTEVNIHNVNKIGQFAFAQCTNITSAKFGRNLKTIGQYAFFMCTSMKDITFGNAVTNISYRAFLRCDILSDVYYGGTEANWSAINIALQNGKLTNATIHYNSEMPDNPEPEKTSKTVKYFSSWDADSQTAYWGERDYVGSKVTDETDISFLENIDNLLNHYVLVETKSRDDGMVDSDYLISIKAVESKKGTVSSADSTSIVIDNNTYRVPEGMEMPEIYVDSQVLYHVVNDEIVGIEALTAKDGTLKEWNADSRKLTIIPDDLNAEKTAYRLSNLADDESVKLLEKLKNDAHIRYVIDSNKFVYQINEIAGSTETGIKTIKYWDDLEEVEKSTEIYWGADLFEEDSRNIDTSNPEYYANFIKVSALLAKCSYDISEDGYLNQVLSKLGASNFYINIGDEYANPAHSFSYCTFNDGDDEQKVVIVTLRGSSHVTDWLTDFSARPIPSTKYPKEHEGFSEARNRIMLELKDYISKNEIDTSTAKILITGHSYGAAVANLLAKSVEGIFEKDDIFGYTFASPNNIVINVKNEDMLENNIHNFRNVWDPVIHVPPSGFAGLEEIYTIYGHQYYFTLEDIGDEAESLFWNNHNCTHYVNYALKMTENNPITRFPVRYIQIRCPIDVEAYDKNGNIVGKICNNKVDEDVTKITMLAVDDEKTIIIPADGSVKLSLTATDAGTMNFEVYDYDVVSGDVSAVKTFNNVTLVDGKLFSSNIAVEIATSNIQLEVVDKDGNKLATVNEDGSETPETLEGHKHTVKLQNAKEATCTEKGYTGDKVCIACGETIEKGTVILAKGHEDGEWTVVKEAICIAEGNEVKKCVVCEEILEERIIKKAPHTYNKGEVIREADCVSGSEIKHTCTECGYEDIKTGKPLGHSFGKWVITKQPTAEEDGVQERVCETCGEKEVGVLAKLSSENKPEKPSSDAEDKKDTNSDNGTVETGDASSIGMVIFGIVASFLVLISMLVFKKKDCSC